MITEVSKLAIFKYIVGTILGCFGLIICFLILTDILKAKYYDFVDIRLMASAGIFFFIVITITSILALKKAHHIKVTVTTNYLLYKEKGNVEKIPMCEVLSATKNYSGAWDLNISLKNNKTLTVYMLKYSNCCELLDFINESIDECD